MNIIFSGTVLAGCFAIATTGYLTALAWKRRENPAAKPLLALAVLLFCTTVVYFILYVPGPVRATLATLTGYEFEFGSMASPLAIMGMLVGGCWFLFALQYTGRGPRLTVVVFGLLAIFGITAFSTGLVVPSLLELEVEGAHPIVVAIALTGFLITVLALLGIGLVLETAWSRNAVGLEETALLAGGAVVFLSTELILRVVTHPAVYPLTTTLASVLFIVAVRTYPVSDAPPAVRITGRDHLVEEMSDAVLVVDRKGQIRDLNAAAEQMFSVHRSSVSGTPIEEVLPLSLDPETLTSLPESASVETTDGQTLAVTANRITDTRGRWFGHSIHCTDVTSRTRREHRLSVLNQLLTGAIRHQMVTVAERSCRLRNELEADSSTHDPGAEGAKIKRIATETAELVARVRAVERHIRDENRKRLSLTELVVDESKQLENEYRFDLSVDTPEQAVVVRTDPDMVRTVLGMLLARRQRNERVTVSVQETGHGAEIHVIIDSEGVAVTDSEETTSGRDEQVDSRDETTSQLTRLALEHIGGTLTTVESGDFQVVHVVRLPSEDSMLTAGQNPPVSESSEYARGEH